MKYCLTSLKLRANIVVNLDPNLIQDDLRERTDFLQRWQIERPPDTYWLTALFEPGVSVTYMTFFITHKYGGKEGRFFSPGIFWGSLIF